MAKQSTSGGFGPDAHESGTRDLRKPLLPHLVDDHGGDVDHVYGSRVADLLDEHFKLHAGQKVAGYAYRNIRDPLP